MHSKYSPLRLTAVIVTLLTSWFCIAADSVAPTVTILDMTARSANENEESGDYSRQLYSATYMCDIAGYPYTVSADLDEAMESPVILFSSVLTSSSFTKAELQSLIDWVEAGGVLVSPALRSSSSTFSPLYSRLFGIDASASAVRVNDRPVIEWNTEYAGDPELSYFDEKEEIETSIGKVKAFLLKATEADILASFPTGESAVLRHNLGSGKSYIAGVTWRDVIQRNQLNKDSGSSRKYNNGFEPSSDIWAFFLRGICAAVNEVSAWKFTVPRGYTQLLVPTHDCDSRTAYDAMHFMADYEKSMGFTGHYFLTVHYYSDKKNFGHTYLSDFYNSVTIPKAADILRDGHTVGSHSIAHFPDFNNCRNTDIVTREEYAKRATCIDGKSSGASTWAELVLSKNIITSDLGNNVRSFRSGHLCVNPDFNSMLEEGGYDFASCYTAGDLLSEFPFFGRIDNDWSGRQSSVLQMPLHISDVYNNKDGYEGINEDNWNNHIAVDEWETAMKKLRGNYASAILLIHPNHEWKMSIQKKLIDRLDLSEVGLYNFEDYGDFWKARLSADHTFSYDERNRRLTIVTDMDAVDRYGLTFGVECNDVEVPDVIITDPSGSKSRTCGLKEIAPGRYLAIPGRSSGIDTVTPSGGQLGFTPVVSGGQLFVDDNGPFRIYDLTGLCVLAVAGHDSSEAIDISSLSSGCYIVRASTGASAKILKR